MDANDFAHAFGMRVESRMAKKPANGRGDLAFMFANVEEHQAVTGVHQTPIPEIPIAREESRALEPVQNRENVIIAGAGPCQVRSDLPDGNAPLTQPPDLDLRDVFVDDEHAA